MALIPPRRSICAAVCSSSKVMQSQRIFPWGVWTSKARCPIANFGSVPIPTRPGSCSFTTLWNPSACIVTSVVHCWPSCPTYWRASRQIGHPGGGVSLGGNCVPHVLQIHFSIDELLSFAISRLSQPRDEYISNYSPGVPAFAPVIQHTPFTVQNGMVKKNLSKPGEQDVAGGCYGNRIVSFYTRTR